MHLEVLATMYAENATWEKLKIFYSIYISCRRRTPDQGGCPATVLGTMLCGTHRSVEDNCLEHTAL